jgi:hypothetical protein
MANDPAQRLKDLQKLSESQEQSATETATAQDTATRQTLAKMFVYFYFGLLFLILVGVPTYNYFIYKVTHDSALVISIKDALLTYSGILGPTFGMVITYYFQSKTNDRD